MGKKRTIDLKIWIGASPARVFKALTVAKELDRWFMKGSETDPKLGGRFLIRFGRGGFESRFLRFQPGKAVTFRWFDGTSFGAGAPVAFALKRQKGGTLVRLIHRGTDLRPEAADSLVSHVEGWTAYLVNLRSVLEYGHDLRSGQGRGSVL